MNISIQKLFSILLTLSVFCSTVSLAASLDDRKDKEHKDNDSKEGKKKKKDGDKERNHKKDGDKKHKGDGDGDKEHKKDGDKEGKKKATRTPRSVLGFNVKDITGKEVRLNKYRGKVLIIVNVASQCGLTDGQYTALERLYKKYKEKGLEILAFPANEFGKQEPGTNKEIQEFCKAKGVSFPLFSKIVVKGDGIHPLYKFLTGKKTAKKLAGDVKWNFQKYVVDRKGKLVAKLAPNADPMSEAAVKQLEKLLAEKAPAKRKRGANKKDKDGDAEGENKKKRNRKRNKAKSDDSDGEGENKKKRKRNKNKAKDSDGEENSKKKKRNNKKKDKKKDSEEV